MSDSKKYWTGDGSLAANRRDFLKLMGFSMAGSLLASCVQMPVEKAIPFLIKPEEVTPGVANWYATTCGACPAACPLVVKVRDGRPIKIEGNELSPLSKGGACAVGLASLLSLYDDQRLRQPILNGKDASWDEVDNFVKTGLQSQAAGKIVLLSGTLASPTTRALIAEWSKVYPGSEHVMFDAVSLAAVRLASEKSFGVKALPHYRFDLAKEIVAFNADFLGTWISPVEFTKAYSKNRLPGERMSHHVHFESRMSITGANADVRWPIAPSEEKAILAALLKSVATKAGQSVSIASLPHTVEPKIIQDSAERLWSHRGSSLVVSGTNDVATQMLVNSLNSLLGNIGKTVDLDNPSNQKQGDDESMSRLLKSMDRGEVKALILHGVNPAYDWKDAAAFANGLKKVPLIVSMSDRLDETSGLAHVVAPDHHYLESWGDAEPVAGLVSFQQPTIRSLFETRQAEDSLLKWMGRTEDFYSYLQESFKKNYPNASWDRSVHDGVLSLPAKDASDKNLVVVAPEIKQDPMSEGAYQLDLYEKVGLRDGRHANNPWLQELPDPVTKVTWDNYASVAPKTAKALGLEDGDLVQLKNASGSMEIPVLVQPGQDRRTISVALGYGRTRCGKVGEKVGVNAYPFLSSAVSGVVVQKLGKKIEFARTQTHNFMEGRPIIKEASLSEFLKDPSAGNEREHGEHGAPVSLWEEKERKGHAWGMVIDLNKCTGCSACLIGCQSENNVPVVGRDEVRRSREMHWIRIDRYYSGSYDSGGETALPPNPPSDKPGASPLPAEGNPPPVAEPLSVVFMPMMCQHCEHAPCETVCPVLATTHSTDGLNMQTYNRCVGTRYCANNCPYKVRRFNWFDYAHNDKFDFNMNNPVGEMVLNPDLVVRSRGVMEKCSMCLQRIQEGKLTSKKEGRHLKDGEIKTACQQSCPADAIVFGDMNNHESVVAQENHNNKRFYHVLEDLGVRPVVGYLTKIRNRDEGKG